MRNKIMGAIGVIFGCYGLGVAVFVDKVRGLTPGVVMGLLLVVVGAYYFIQGDAKRRPRESGDRQA